MAINPVIKKWFNDRGIHDLALEAMKIFTGKRQPDGVVTPDETGDIIVFPYWQRGQMVNAKYRASGKRLWQQTGGKKVFYNVDVVADPSLHNGTNALVIVEGEPDLLAVLTSGNPFVVSVPDGAPPANSEISEDAEPSHDDKYGYVFECWEDLKKVKRVVIAVDNDEPGKILAEQLVRRIGRARCSFVTYPDGCKDLNEVLQNHGAGGVAKAVESAKPYPVSGVYSFADLPLEPALKPVGTGFYQLDDYLKVFYPALMVVTGFAGSGKSSLVNQIVAQIATLHGWKAAIASFEMRIKPFISDVLVNTYLHVNPRANAESAAVWLNENFVFIAPEPSDEDNSFNIEWLIDRAITAVVRYGIRILVIDPWNEIEHAIDRHESLTNYTGRAIRALKRFGREFECLVIVVAHPTKNAANKEPQDVNLYDVSDSAHFANKADFGLVVARKGSEADYLSEIFVRKVRYQPMTGKPGSVTLMYDPTQRIFMP